MLAIDLVSPLFSEEKSKYYILSIQISLDGLCFSIRDYLSNSFIALKVIPKPINTSLTDFLGELFVNEKLFQLTYRDVKIVFNTFGYTTIPEPLFSSDSVENIFRLNYSISNEDKILHFKHKDLPLRSAFAVPYSIDDIIAKKFNAATVYHIQDITIWSGQLLDENIEEQIVIHFHDNFFHLAGFASGKFTFNNSFNYKTAEDFAFFALNAIKQLDFDHETVHIIIRGEIERNDSKIQLLKRFSPNVSFEALPASFHYSDIIYQKPSHFYTTLFLAQQCE